MFIEAGRKAVAAVGIVNGSDGESAFIMKVIMLANWVCSAATVCVSCAMARRSCCLRRVRASAAAAVSGGDMGGALGEAVVGERVCGS